MLDLINEFKNALSLYLLIPLVGTIGLLLSFRFGFIQCSHVFTAWKLFITDRDHTGKRASSFSAVSAALGGNLGTGNISGIAVALTMGGPGALFWMWIMATLGAVLKFVNCALGVLYRQKNDKGENVGGPMYYLSKGLNLKRTSKFYCLLIVCGALTVGNLVQMNSLAIPLISAGVPPYLCGAVMSVLVAAVILGGLHRFSAVVSWVIPFKAITYISLCLVIILLNIEKLLPALKLVFQCAFHPSSVAGGVIGFTILEAVKVGFDRGLFATDVGIGMDSIVHSSVESKDSLKKQRLHKL